MSEIRTPKIRVNLPHVGALNIEVTPVQRNAAWALYIELTTRVTVQPLEAHHGSIREALNSLYSLFEITRNVLKAAGPDVAKETDSVGAAALSILNERLRPFLTQWHTSFSKYELSQATAEKHNPSGFVDDESKWEDYQTFFQQLAELQSELETIVTELGRIAQA